MKSSALLIAFLGPPYPSHSQFFESGGGIIFQHYHYRKKDRYVDAIPNLSNSRNWAVEMRWNDWRLVNKPISVGCRFSMHYTKMDTRWSRHGYGGGENAEIRTTVLDLDCLPWKLGMIKDHLIFRPGFHTQIILTSFATGSAYSYSPIPGSLNRNTTFENDPKRYQVPFNPGFTLLLTGKILQKETWYLSISSRLDWSPFAPFADRQYLSRYAGTIQFGCRFRSPTETRLAIEKRKETLKRKAQKKNDRINKRISHYCT